MAIVKPSKLPIWDINGTNIVEPQATNQSDGWQVDANGIPQKPPFQYHNYMWHTQYKWFEYLDAEKALLGGLSTQRFKIANAVNADEAVRKGQITGATPLTGLNADLLDGHNVDENGIPLLRGYLPNGVHSQYTGDLNNININSTYNVDGNIVTNSPVVGRWGFITTEVYTGGFGWARQVWGDMQGVETYTRYTGAGATGWTAWEKTWNSGNDGAGSGLDADLLDGVQLSTINNNINSKLNSSIYTPFDILGKLKTVDGAGSGLDADLLRGLPADFSSFQGGNGYQKLPSGLIFQWGTTALAQNSTITLPLPLAFPLQALVGIGGINSNFIAGMNNSAVVVNIINNTQVQISIGANTAVTPFNTQISWIAIGN